MGVKGLRVFLKRIFVKDKILVKVRVFMLTSISILLHIYTGIF